MKRVIIFITLFFGTLFQTFPVTYEQIMEENLIKMQNSKSKEELTTVASLFERIAAKETTQWLPGYYAAYSYVMMIHIDQTLSADDKNKLLDKAQQHLDRLEKEFYQESEPFALQAMVYQLRIQDPSTAYELSMKASEALNKAEKLNPKNPRVYYLQGCNLFYTPEQYGGGPAKAKPLFEKALLLFEPQKPDQPLLPDWGKEHCQHMNRQCSGK